MQSSTLPARSRSAAGTTRIRSNARQESCQTRPLGAACRLGCPHTYVFAVSANGARRPLGDMYLQAFEQIIRQWRAAGCAVSCRADNRARLEGPAVDAIEKGASG